MHAWQASALPTEPHPQSSTPKFPSGQETVQVTVTLSRWVPLLRAKSTSTLSPAASWETGRLPVETPG